MPRRGFVIFLKCCVCVYVSSLILKTNNLKIYNETFADLCKNATSFLSFPTLLHLLKQFERHKF